MPNDVKYLNKREIAAFYRVSAATIERWMDEGKVTFWRTPGGAPRFAQPVVEGRTE